MHAGRQLQGGFCGLALYYKIGSIRRLFYDFMRQIWKPIYAIAHGILLIGGAVCVILALIMAVLMISILVSINTMTRDVKKKVDLFQSYLVQTYEVTK
jgi:hypothetical protein